jgi:hypothetical protein
MLSDFLLLLPSFYVYEYIHASENDFQRIRYDVVTDPAAIAQANYVPAANTVFVVPSRILQEWQDYDPTELEGVGFEATGPRIHSKTLPGQFRLRLKPPARSVWNLSLSANRVQWLGRSVVVTCSTSIV